MALIHECNAAQRKLIDGGRKPTSFSTYHQRTVEIYSKGMITSQFAFSVTADSRFEAWWRGKRDQGS